MHTSATGSHTATMSSTVLQNWLSSMCSAMDAALAAAAGGRRNQDSCRDRQLLCTQWSAQQLAHCSAQVSQRKDLTHLLHLFINCPPSLNSVVCDLLFARLLYGLPIATEAFDCIQIGRDLEATVKTRFATVFRCFVSLLRCKAALKSVISMHNWPGNDPNATAIAF